MPDLMQVTGMVIATFPIAEYDKRIMILTKECGKISAFVKGARRPGSRFVAQSDMFCFGTFSLYVGKTSYNVTDIEVANYFEFMRTDMMAACYGMYFLEVSDYYARENNDEAMLLLLLYRSLQALKVTSFNKRLVRYIFEIRLIQIEGEMLPLEAVETYLNDTRVALSYIIESSIEKLFSFKVSDEVLDELGKIARYLCRNAIDKKMKSLDILEAMEE